MIDDESPEGETLVRRTRRLPDMPGLAASHQFGGGDDAIPPWLERALRDGRAWYQGGDAPYITMSTPHGEMRANVGDWIILGLRGELFACGTGDYEGAYVWGDSIRIGRFLLYEGRSGPGKIWITLAEGPAEGEGAEFDATQIEALIAQFYEANF